MQEWHSDLIIPNEIVSERSLDLTDKFLIGIIRTVPEISVEQIVGVLGDKLPKQEISKRLKNLAALRYIVEEKNGSGYTIFKIKNILTLNIKSQKSQTIQDQENSVPEKKRIISRRKLDQNPNALIYSERVYKEKNNSMIENSVSTPLGVDTLDDPEQANKKFIPSIVQPFLDVWFIHDLYISGDGTKAFAEDIEALKKLITGRFFSTSSGRNVPFQYLDRKFTLEEWTHAVKTMHKIAFDPSYRPANKSKLQKMRIKSFLYNEYTNFQTKERTNSTFLLCLENRVLFPKSGRSKFSPEEDLHPNMTARLIHLFAEYRKEVRGQYEYKPSDEEMDRFKMASSRISKFFDDRQKDIIDYHNAFSVQNAKTDFTWAAVLHDIKNSDFELTPGFLCSDTTFEKRLPNYLTFKRMMR